MSKMLRLGILGIRSFGADDGDQQCIAFNSPLTLILGENGCGKTTLIEALKYATAGDLPKGQGQAFVHDPKMSGRSEVYAQVKLEFIDIMGEKVTVVRSLKSTQRAKDLKTATIDQTITRVDKNGEKQSITQRCSDVNAEMSRSLGVSKAVLENVIFCHQEDSTWPLDESKKLKEKFDAIFDATKYNKCLEDIRKLHKEKKGELGRLETAVSFLQNYKVEAEEKRTNLAALERQLANLRDEIKEYNQQLNPISERLDHIHKVNTNLANLEKDLATKKVKLEGIRKQLVDLKKNIRNPYPGSMEELRQAIASFKNQLKDKDRCLSNLTEELSEATKEEKETRNEIGSEQVKVGRLIEEEKQYKMLLKDCSSKLQVLANQLSIPQTILSSDEETSDYEIRHMLDQVDKKMKSLEAEFERDRRQCKTEEEKLQSLVNEARDKKVKLEQEVHMKEQQLTANKNETSKLKAEIEEVQLSAGRLTRLEEESKGIEEQLKALESKSNLEDGRLEIQNLKDKRMRLQSKMEDLNKEVQSLQQQSRIQTELNVHTETKNSKESEIKRIKRKHSDTLKHLLQNIPERRFKYALEACLEKLKESKLNMDVEISRRDKELTELDTNRKHLKEQLRKKQDTLNENEEKLYSACGSEEFDDVLRKLSKEIENLQDLKGDMSSRENLFKRYIRKLQQEAPCCPLCHRDFTSNVEAEDLVSDLSNQVRELPQRLRENKDKLKDLEEKYSNLLQLKPVQEKTSLMKDNEIPTLRTKVSAIEGQIKDIKQELDKLRNNVRVPELDIELANSTMNDMVLLDQSEEELLRINKEIERISARMPPGSGRTMDEALSEQENAQMELQEVQKQLERKQTDVNAHSEKISKLREARNNNTSEILKIQGGLQASNSVRERLKELEQLKVAIGKEISERTRELHESIEALRNIQQKKEEDFSKLQKELYGKQAKLEEVKRNVIEIKSMNKRVEDMKMKGVEQNVVAAQTKLARLQKKLDDAVESHRDIAQRINNIRSDLSTQQVKERELKDNLNQKELELQETTLDIEVGKLKAEVGNLEFGSLRKEWHKLTSQEEEIKTKKSHSEGRQKEKESHIFSLEKELNKNDYKNADKNYRDKYLELFVQKKACEDLLKFYAALDYSLKYFHKERMESINAIIRELWTIVYKGNDVETIEIRTDEMGDTLVASDKRRSYSYRVVMKKKDTELDMRGRCSAGQKMLASLIIRMALAETFSAHCGILALDEPTTNLDAKNSVSLSEALAEIVKRRSSQKNFQLIVITHDREFIESLAQDDDIRYYYNISRDSEGKSRIKRKDI